MSAKPAPDFQAPIKVIPPKANAFFRLTLLVNPVICGGTHMAPSAMRQSKPKGFRLERWLHKFAVTDMIKAPRQARR